MPPPPPGFKPSIILPDTLVLQDLMVVIVGVPPLLVKVKDSASSIAVSTIIKLL